MTKEKQFFQCTLSKGSARQVSFIEDRGSVVGKVVELEPGSGDFWTVEQVSDRGLPESQFKVFQEKVHKDWNRLNNI